MGIEKGIFNRTSLLLGDDVMGDIYQKRVIIFGLGGVGSWCAESLVRSGIKELVLVDSDRVCVTNVNRQLMATTKTVGQVKVDVLKNRLLEINPHANIVALQDIYEEANTDKFQLDTFDYIIDAIDSLENKMQLLWHATSTKATVFSSMGAALKMDPTRIKVAEFWKVAGCPLARALRDKFKKKKMALKKKVLCVFAERTPACAPRCATKGAKPNSRMQTWSITNGAAARRKSTAPWHTPPLFLDSRLQAS